MTVLSQSALQNVPRDINWRHSFTVIQVNNIPVVTLRSFPGQKEWIKGPFHTCCCLWLLWCQRCEGVQGGVLQAGTCSQRYCYYYHFYFPVAVDVVVTTVL